VTFQALLMAMQLVKTERSQWLISVTSGALPKIKTVFNWRISSIPYGVFVLTSDL
jgi:hypothetical protein